MLEYKEREIKGKKHQKFKITLIKISKINSRLKIEMFPIKKQSFLIPNTNHIRTWNDTAVYKI